MEQLIVDREFEGKIPPLTQEEFEQLEANIVADGAVREDIIVWNNIIVDGHNRWKIIQKHPEIPFGVRQMDFGDKWAAFEWMYRNQLGRRNVTAEQRAYIIGKLYEARKKVQGGTGANQHNTQRAEIRPSAKGGHATAESIATELGVGNTTVRDSASFAKGVDAVREIDPTAADKILQGKSGATRKEISKAPKMSSEETKELVRRILDPTPKRSTANDTIQQIVSDLKANKPAPGGCDFVVDIACGLKDTIRGVKATLVQYSTKLNEEAREQILTVLEESEKSIIELKGLVKQ